MLLPFTTVAFELMAGMIEVARFFGIVLGLCTANFAYQNMEVGEDFFVPDESGKQEFLERRHSLPPAESIAKGRHLRRGFFL